MFIFLLQKNSIGFFNGKIQNPIQTHPNEFWIAFIGCLLQKSHLIGLNVDFGYWKPIQTESIRQWGLV